MTLARLHRYGSIVLVFLVLALAVRDLAPRGDFGVTDAQLAEARRDLEVIARETRPSGSEANVAARAYLRGRLEELGLVVEEQRWSERDRELVNLITRVPGSQPTGALLVLAHHDSVRRGPGAADDGSGCVAILALARELVAGPQLDQDVLLVLSDGEELGLLGAKHFRDTHPAMKDVRAVVNLEAMGGAGPLVCFQMSKDNADLVSAWARGPHPVGSSFAEVVYSQMPNDSDLSVFLGVVPGMNFALVGGCSVYHQAFDTADRVEDASLRHEIATLVSCTRHLASTDLRDSAPARNWFQWPLLGTLEWGESPPEWGMLSVLGLLLVLDTPGTRKRRTVAILRGIAGAVALLVAVALPAFGIGYAFIAARAGAEELTSYGEVNAMIALQAAWAFAVLCFLARWSHAQPKRNGLLLEASCGALIVASLAGLLYHVQGLGLRSSDGLPLRAMCTAAAFAFLVAQRTSGLGRWFVALLLLATTLTFAPFVGILPQIGSQLEWL
ncbi:MAG: M28 family peptidase, partial [Planctomycetes bacterium]|nr:M28 family peptidase [Planctomycetota bacterium]